MLRIFDVRWIMLVSTLLLVSPQSPHRRVQFQLMVLRSIAASSYLELPQTHASDPYMMTLTARKGINSVPIAISGRLSEAMERYDNFQPSILLSCLHVAIVSHFQRSTSRRPKFLCSTCIGNAAIVVRQDQHYALAFFPPSHLPSIPPFHEPLLSSLPYPLPPPTSSCPEYQSPTGCSTRLGRHTQHQTRPATWTSASTLTH